LKGKNRLRNGAAIAAAAAAVVAATAGIAAASVSAPKITSPTTIVLQAHGGSATFVNVAHKKGRPSATRSSSSSRSSTRRTRPSWSVTGS